MKKKVRATIVCIIVLVTAFALNNTTVKASTRSSAAKYLKGTWETGSYDVWNGETQPMYYVKFTKNYIKYGHMKNGTYVLDYKDKILKVEKVKKNCYRLKAKASNGYKYMYQNDGKKYVGYYGTWKKSKMNETYSGGSSLVKS